MSLDPGGAERLPRWLWVAQVAIVAACYFALAELDVLMSPPGRGLVPVWPPTGLAVAALVLAGVRLWPGVLAGAFWAAWMSGAGLAASLALSAGATTEAVIAASLLRGAGFRPGFDRIQDVLALIGAGGVATFVGALVGTLGLGFGGHLPADQWVSVGVSWWLGSAMSVVVLGALVLAWAMPGTRRWGRRRRLEALAVLVLIAVTGAGVFLEQGYAVHLREYVLLPLVAWAALRLGPRGTTLAVALVGGTAVLGLAQGLGPFTDAQGAIGLANLHLFLGVCAATGLLLATIAAERDFDQLLGEGEAAVLERVASGAPLTEVLEAVARFVEDHSGPAQAVVLLRDERGLPRAVAAPSLSPRLLATLADADRDSGLMAGLERLVQPRTVIVADLVRDPAWEDCRAVSLAHGLAACASVPVPDRQGAVIGALCLFPTAPRSPSPHETRLLHRAARVAGIAVEGHRTQEALRRSEARLRAIVDTALDAVVTMDARGVVTSWNAQAEATFGWPRHEAIGRTVAELVIPPQLRDLHAAGLERFVRTGEGPILERRIEIDAQHRDGRTLPVELTVTAIGSGESATFAAFVRDITERRQMQRRLVQTQRLESIGTLAGGLAHDFNNLLTPVMGNAELLASSLPDGASRQLAEEIRDAAERATALVSQLLAFGRRQVMQPVVLDVNEVVTEMARLLRRMAGDRVDLVLDLAEDPWSTLADRTQLEQAVVNLVVHARDVMADGGRITIRTRNVELDEDHAVAHPEGRPGPHVAIVVEDTGPGMDAEAAACIFEPFLDGGERPGLGLGLASVHGIVRQTGGHVTVQSQPGRGTTFHVYLPRHEGKAALRVERPLADLATGTESILLVEDDPMVRTMAKRILERCGYSVVPADGAAEAMEAVRSKQVIDLVVSDVMMPELNGPDLVAQMKQVRPDLKVLFVSGYADEAMHDSGVLASGVHFLAKPFTPRDLSRKVREVLDGVPAPG